MALSSRHRCTVHAYTAHTLACTDAQWYIHICTLPCKHVFSPSSQIFGYMLRLWTCSHVHCMPIPLPFIPCSHTGSGVFPFWLSGQVKFPIGQGCSCLQPMEGTRSPRLALSPHAASWKESQAASLSGIGPGARPGGSLKPLCHHHLPAATPQLHTCRKGKLRHHAVLNSSFPARSTEPGSGLWHSMKQEAKSCGKKGELLSNPLSFPGWGAGSPQRD